jgi:RNA polymerase sigma factor (TIGR02999 family)
MRPSRESVTRLLVAWSDGDAQALEALTDIVHRELLRLARSYMAREKPGHLLQPTALVNEAYLRLVQVQNTQWQNRAHFFAVASKIMRRILVDFARSRRFIKRGGDIQLVPYDEAMHLRVEPQGETDLVQLDEALSRLEKIDPVKSQVVELRFFGGLAVNEIATVLNVSESSVLNYWRFAKAWLVRELGGKDVDGI